MNDAPTEYEVKFFPISINDMRKQLELVKATQKTPERLMRRCVFSAEANPRMSCTYIRIRDEGNKVTMSAKQHATDGNMASQKEYETIVEDFETARHILLNAGLEQTGYQENRRETWQMPDGTLVELETWPGLPNYLEIEGASEEAVKKTAGLLELNWSQHLIKSNDYLYAQHLGIDRETVLKKMSRLTFADSISA